MGSVKEEGPWQCGNPNCDRIIESVHQRNNGDPFVNAWVCDLCNAEFVIPMRLSALATRTLDHT